MLEIVQMYDVRQNVKSLELLEIIPEIVQMYNVSQTVTSLELLENIPDNHTWQPLRYMAATL